MRGTTKRRFKTMRLGFKIVFLELEVQRVGCLDCDSIRQVPLGFANA
ncbi:MAG TPA: ISL3 family transposase, partial [Syntrophales bacterium]|nr:ISL3 family transposase [Syntrophales bacterium]